MSDRPARMTEAERIAKATEAAQALAGAGFGIVEAYGVTDDGACRCRAAAGCPSPGKHPVGDDWQRRATRSPHSIAQLVARSGQYGVIPWPGERGLILDVDHADRLPVKLPPTLRVKSRPGRGHAYFRLPEGYDARQAPATAPWGEIRVEGASRHVIGPWSRHASGTVYEPVGDVAAIAELPAGILGQLFPPARPTLLSIGNGAGYQLPAPGYEGSRYSAIRDYLASRYMRGVSEAEIWAGVRDVLAPRFAEPLTEAELRERFERASHGTAKRLGEPMPEPITINTAKPAAVFPEPEDFGLAQPSPLANVEYVGDFIRPGRLVTWAAEEGRGKSFAVDAELAVRVALTGGSFAETWPVLRQGPVLVLSEMHADDDIGRLERVCGALQRSRSELEGRYYRLPLYAAAGGEPCLAVPEWRRYIVDWCRERGVLLAVFDTATGAVDVDPWGREIQRLFRDLRTMLAEYPELAIVLIVHLKKPSGRGVRRLSDVLGEWGRWNDVTVLMEADGLEQVRLEVRKRVTRERRIVVTKRDGLLVDPREPQAGGPKVPQDRFLAAVAAAPGLTPEELAGRLGVTDRTIRRYARSAGGAVRTVEIPLKGSTKRLQYFPIDADNADNGGNEHVSASLSAADGVSRGQRTAPYIRGAVLSASTDADDGDLTNAARAVFGDLMREGKA